VGFFDGTTPRLFGHRGAAAVVPENTVPSFERAIRDGAEYLEFDVHATADGHVVVIHDSTVNRTTDGNGAVREFGLAALRRLDAGYRFTAPDGSTPARGRGVTVPTLDEVLGGFPAIPVTIEVKPAEPCVAERVVDSVVAHGATDRVLVATARDDLIPHLRAACTAHGIATNFAAAEVADFVRRVSEGDLAGYTPPGTALQIPPDWKGIPLITAATVAAAHGLGVEVHAWTINERAEMERLLSLGVDGIMTDIPALGRRVIDEYRASRT
jgi:glycerophosphoryl diester phosphodiesterase